MYIRPAGIYRYTHTFFFHPNCTPKYPMIFPGVVDQTPPVELAFLEATEPPNSPIFTEVSDHSDIPAPGPTCCGLCDELRGERVGCRHGNMWKLGLYMVIICYYTVTPLVSLDLGKNMKKWGQEWHPEIAHYLYIHINTYYICKRFKESLSPWVADKKPSVQGNN